MGSGILETSAALHNIKRDLVAMAAGGSTLPPYREKCFTKIERARAQFVPAYRDEDIDDDAAD